MPDPISMIPAGAKFDTLRAMLKILKRDHPQDYAGLSKQDDRVRGWVQGINNGDFTADDKRDDIVQHIIGKERAMKVYGISEAEFEDLVKGGNEGGINFADIADYRGQSLNNIPGAPQVWKVGSESYVVYEVPGTEDDPVYMAWLVPSDDDLEAMFGPDQKVVYDRTMNAKAFQRLGVLEFGSTDEIPATERDPFATWAQEMEMQAVSQPWILDDDYQALMAMSIIEGRQLSDSEIATTEWWRTHNKNQRDWMKMYHGDPSEAENFLAERELAVAEMIRQSGGGEADPGLVKAIAMQWSHGNWTQAYTTQQVKAITDPYSQYEVDEVLIPLVEANPVTHTNAEEDRVRELLNTWLGPAFGNWGKKEIARMAGELRNNPNAENDLVESLKDQRMAVLPGYTDRNLSYQAIANTWKQFYIGQWGQNPDETSNLWLKVLKANDTEASGQLLRREGYKRGIPKVVSDLNSQTLENTGGSVRRGVYA